MSCLQIIPNTSTVNLRQLSGNVSKSNSNVSKSISNLSVKSHFTGISTAATGTPTAVLSSSPSIITGDDHDRNFDKFDEWIRNSVTEIVKNIKQAPLLVQINADDGVVKTETKVVAEDWPELIKSKTMDGIILVEELGENVSNEFEDGTKAFGVLIQGKFKGRDRCKSACYLLKTSSVNGGGGIGGVFCTHFCLMKVRSFSKSASSQFNDCWLLQ